MPIGIAITAASRNAAQTRAVEISAFSISSPLAAMFQIVVATSLGGGRNVGSNQPSRSATSQDPSSRMLVATETERLALRERLPRKLNAPASHGWRGVAGTFSDGAGPVAARST